jgi:sarcosine oxidase delta subunit
MSAQTDMFPYDAPPTDEDAIAIWREHWTWPVGIEKTIAFGRRASIACPWCEKRINLDSQKNDGATMLRHIEGCDKFVHITHTREGERISELKHVAVRAEARK